MKTYRIVEEVVYHVEAEDEDEAESIFLNSDDPNQYFVAVTEREVEEA